MWNSREPGRAVERSSTATISPGSSRPRSADDPRSAHVDRGGRVAGDLELGGNVAELQRHPDAPLDHVLAGDGQPQQRGQRDGAAPSARGDGTGNRPSDVVGRRGRALAARLALHDRANAAARAGHRASSPRSIGPSSASEICPVSSDTTTATASLSSVRPIAARCRVPSSRPTRGLTVSGRKHAAAATRSSWRMTAPSCSGEPG